MLHIKINTENDAFQGGNREFELSRILMEIAQKIEAGEQGFLVRDSNGNTVGAVVTK